MGDIGFSKIVGDVDIGVRLDLSPSKALRDTIERLLWGRMVSAGGGLDVRTKSVSSAALVRLCENCAESGD